VSNLSLNLVATARNYPDRSALRCDELELTFSQFDTAGARVATFLEQEGIEPGDRVGLMLPNTPAFAVAYYGILRRGAVAVPMNPLLKAREIEFYLTNTGAKALFATPFFAEEDAAGTAAAGAQCGEGGLIA
jgi:long-chain acyl-CoA synthetase